MNKKLSTSSLLVAALVGSLVVAETAQAKTSLPLNRSQLQNNNNSSGASTRAFGRNVSMNVNRRSSSQGYRRATIGRSGGFVQRSVPTARTRSIPTSNFVATPQNFSTPSVVATPNVVSTPNVVTSAPVVYGSPVVTSAPTVVYSSPVLAAPRQIVSEQVIASPQRIATSPSSRPAGQR